MNNENDVFINTLEINGSEEEIILAPPTELFDEAKEIVQTTVDDEKFSFMIQYDANQKDFLLSLLETVGAIVEDDDEKGRTLSTQMNMTQLTFMKRLDCVERVKTDEGSNPFLAEEAIIQVQQNEENTYLTEDAGSTVHTTSFMMDDISVSAIIEEKTDEGVSVASVATTSSCSTCPCNTSMDTAMEISYESYIRGCICCPGAEQWFKFTVPQTGNYTICTTGSLDTVGTLYDASGNQLVEINDYKPCGKLNFRIIYNLTADTIYYVKVRVADNSTGNYTLRVTEKVLANYVNINKSTITLIKGETYELPTTPNYIYKGYNGAKPIPNFSVSINPTNTTEQKIWWYVEANGVLKCSYGWDNDGARYAHVTVIGNGMSKLYANDWSESGKGDVCTVKIDPREKVIVEKDSNKDYSRIIFNNGKVWNCINRDIINDYNLNMSDLFSQRFYENTYQERYVEEETGRVYYYKPMKEYTEDEIKLIYTIDPHGLSAYVKEYASQLFKDGTSVQDSLKRMLNYKDEVFFCLFKRHPKYYKRNIDSTWYQTTDMSDLKEVLSESEFLFGQHVIYDIVTLKEFINVVIDIFSMAICPYLKTLTFLSNIEKLIKYYSLLSSVAESVLNQDFNGFIYAIATGTIEESMLDDDFVTPTEYKTKNYTLGWVDKLLSLGSNLKALADTFKNGPNFYKEIFTHCDNDLNYHIMIRTTDDKLVSISDIKNLIE